MMFISQAPEHVLTVGFSFLCAWYARIPTAMEPRQTIPLPLQRKVVVMQRKVVVMLRKTKAVAVMKLVGMINLEVVQGRRRRKLRNWAVLRCRRQDKMVARTAMRPPLRNQRTKATLIL